MGVNVVAFQDASGNLGMTGSELGGVGQPMWPGTSPSLCQFGSDANQLALAFQLKDGNLFVLATDGTATGEAALGMKEDTSPSLCALGWGWGVAFQDNNGFLYLNGNLNWGEKNTNTDPEMSMLAARTSPCISKLAGGYVVALQRADGNVLLYGDLKYDEHWARGTGHQPKHHLVRWGLRGRIRNSPGQQQHHRSIGAWEL